MKTLSFCLVMGWLAASCAAPPVPGKTAPSEQEVPPVAGNSKTPRSTPMKNLVETQAAPRKGLKTFKGGRGLNDLTITQSEMGSKKTKLPGPRFTLSAQDVDIKTILLALSKEIDENIVVDPEINKQATVDLKNVTLKEALDSLLKPLGLSYEIENDFIRVSRKGLVTRIFPLNYVISRRISASRVQASSGSGVTGIGTNTTSSGSGFGGLGSLSGGTGSSGTSGSSLGLGGSGTGGSGNQRTLSQVASFEETDLWKEIENGLKNILGPVPATGTSSTTNRQAPSGGQSLVNGRRTYYSINKQAGIILVRNTPEILLKVAEFIERIEGSVQRQVFIQAKIIEVVLSGAYQLGIDWKKVSPVNIVDVNPVTGPGTLVQGAIRSTEGFLPGVSRFTLGISDTNINLVIDALARQGEVSVLSSPKIATLNNQRAVIKVGTEDVFFIPETVAVVGASTTNFIPETVTIGIVLDVLPQINANGQVMMSINTSISEKTGERTSPNGDNVIPILDVRESNSVVLASNGQTIIIGGLMKNKTETNINGVPLLQDIPYLGRIFQRKDEKKEKSELVIMLTPHIMAGKAIDDQRGKAEHGMKKLRFPTEEHDFYQSFN